jgi:RimJ/RimL family protein N-acetyltransferase
MTVPTVSTERLILRDWRDSDLDAHAAMSADAEVQRFLSGGPIDRIQAWREMALHAGHWALRGYGNWAVERKEDGVFLGRVGLWNPEGWFGLEVGWKLARHAWGNGYATEAARASVEWGFTCLDAEEIISVIRPANVASIAVARRLGMSAVREAEHGGATVVIYSLTRPD